jgi:hypothetical protein
VLVLPSCQYKACKFTDVQWQEHLRESHANLKHLGLGDVLKKFISLVLACLLGLGATPAEAASKLVSPECSTVSSTTVPSVISDECDKSDSQPFSMAVQKVSKKFKKQPKPSITGLARVDESLSANLGVWDAGVKFKLQWLANGSVIPGANDRTFVITESVLGKKITLKVVGSKSGYSSATQISTASKGVIKALVTVSSALTNRDLLSTPTPEISGRVVDGSTLSAINGKWDSGVSFTYQWIQDGSPIVGATSYQFDLRKSDIGSAISVSVTGAKKGYRPMPKVSESVVVEDSLQAFLSSPTPSILGLAQVGKTLSVSVGSWSPLPSFSYKWKRNGITTPSVGGTYRVTSADLTATISVEIVATRTGFKQEMRESVDTDEVVAATVVIENLTNTPIPLLVGLSNVGESLSADVGTWDDGVSLAFQWKRNGKAILDATDSAFDVTLVDVGFSLSVSVTGSLLGFASVTKTSTQTRKIQAPEFSSTPLPIFTGNTYLGQTLTLDAGMWEPGTIFAVQWQRNGLNVRGATSSTYLITTADLGAVLSVVVVASKTGYQPVSQSSLASGLILAPLLTQTPIPLINGEPFVGKVLNVDSGTWDSGTDLFYQWYRSGVAISGATASAFTLSQSDLGATISVIVLGRKAGFEVALRSSLATLPVTVLTITQTAVPKVVGDLIIGSILAYGESSGSWEPDVTITYQWLRNGVAILGATKSTYTLLDSDAGSTFSVTATGSKPGSISATTTSPTTKEVVALTFDFSRELTIAGSPVVSQLLTASAGSWDATVSQSFQWRRQGIAISGATTSSYTVSSADFGFSISVTVTLKGQGYNTLTRTSAGTALVSNPNFTLAPKPLISGTYKINQTLTGTAGIWDAGTTLTFQWLRNGAIIAGATNATYWPVSEDLGSVIAFSVTGAKSGFVTTTKVSSPTDSIFAGTFSLQPLPTISGTSMVGKTLTGVTGTWNLGTSLSYQWKRNNVSIPGATALTYLLTTSDLSTKITFVVKASLSGNLPLEKVSLDSSTVLAAAIVTQGNPTISGTPVVGTALTGSIGLWETGLSFSYVWKRNGLSISATNSLTYTLVPADLGAVITFSVTASDAYASAVKSSAATALVGLGTFTTSSVPGISGSARVVGSILSATYGSWSPTPTFTFQWLRNTTPIVGATYAQYSLTASDLGAAIAVAVTGASPGLKPITQYSIPTSLITQGTMLRAPAVVILGTPSIGTSLLASGGWASGSTLSYQWFKNSVSIPYETTPTYRPVAADAGSLISLGVTASRPGYYSQWVLTPSIQIQTPPKLPTVSSVFSKINGFDVAWAWTPSTTYVFTAVNSSGASLASFTCASASCVSPFSISGLPTSNTAVSYDLKYTATTDGGSISGSMSASSYPVIALNVTVNSIVHTGDQYVFNFQAIPNWTYQFSNYGAYDNSNCGVSSAIFTSSPLTVWLPRGTCSMEFVIRDDRGNVTSAPIAPNITKVVAPAPSLGGTLSSETVAQGSSINYEMTYSSYYPYYTYLLVILNAAGSPVSPAMLPTSTRSGDSWSGNKSGAIYFTGLAAGTYSIRADFKSTSDLRYGYDQQASIVLGTVELTG